MHNRKLIIKVRVILLYLLVSLSLSAKENYQNETITVADGLSENYVDYIFKDSEGYMWFASGSGVDRFDGYSFKHFSRHSKEAPLSNNFVKVICEDSHKRLWIGTEEGVDIYDMNTGEIQPFSGNKILHNKNEVASINDIYKDHHGNIWIGSSTGICKVLFNNSGEITDTEVMNGNDDLMNIISIFEDKQHRIWLGTNNGAIRLLSNQAPKGFHWQTLPFNTSKLRNLSIMSFVEDSDGYIWIATTRRLFKFSEQQDSPEIFSYGTPIRIPHGHVSDLALDNKNNLWIATLGGVACLNLSTNDVTTFNAHSTTPINNNFINCIYIDDNGIIWIGTEKGGINKLYLTNKQFFSYRNEPNNPNSLSENPVNAILETSNNELWIGNVEGGISRMKNRNGQFKHYRHIDRNSTSISHNSVSVLFEDSNNDIWVGTWGIGLNKYNAKSDNFEQNYGQLGENIMGNNLISAITEDKTQKYLWVGTPAGLNYINRKTKEIRMVPVPNKMRQLNYINHLICDNYNNIWVATNIGVYCIDVNKSDFAINNIAIKHWSNLVTENQSKAPTKVLSVIEASDGTIWFGTYGDGAFYRPAGRDTFITVPDRFNLNSKVIFSIKEDNSNNIWFGTNKGLTRLSQSENTSRTYTQSDGLIDNQMYWNASFKGSDGFLYFGSTEGLIYFNPEKIQDNYSFPKVHFTKVEILNREVKVGTQIDNHTPLSEPLSRAKEIRLKEKDRSISIEFSALSYVATEKIKYAYKLEGFDKEWNEVNGDRHFANYTNLEQGEYRFLVKCTNRDGVWSDMLSEINIVVKPPFYKTIWFLSLAALLLLATTIALTLWRIRFLRLQNFQLEDKVKERTALINDQNRKLEDQAHHLEKTLEEVLANEKVISEKNMTLTEQNEKILKQKNELEELNYKVKEINQERIRFFINISHEFRTPITLILGPLEQLIKTAKTVSTKQKLEMVMRNANRLLSLINQLMDFRKVESGNMKLAPTHGNISEFTKEITTSFSYLANSKNIQLLFKSQPNNINGLFDRNKYQIAITNIISNAIKFTPENGTVSVSITKFEREGDGSWMKIQISDTGDGIPKEDLDRIFERFYQAKQKEMPDTNFSGTGIGLYLTKEFIELHDGTVEVTNKPEGGACFTVCFPIKEEQPEYVAENMEQLNIPKKEAQKNTTIKQKRSADAKPLLLIVEDDSDMRQYICSIFESAYSILEAENGEEGLQLTQQHLPDFIISDIMMPIMDGITFCKNVKSNFSTSHIPVLLLTARSSTEKQIESFDSGANAFVTKPFEQELLFSRVQNLVESRKQLHDKFRYDHDPSTLDLQSNTPNMKFMQKALGVLKEHYTDATFDVGSFVSKMGMSRSLLHKKLQSLAGESASKFIRNYRLNIAKNLMLKELDKNISEIAYEVGFNDPKYFTRCFTKQFGMSPRKYIDDNQQND